MTPRTFFVEFLFIASTLSLCIFADFSDITDPSQDSTLIHDHYGTGDYLSFSKFIDPSKIHTILEIGSRDAIDAIQLGYYYKCPVYAFECNPEGLERCYNNTASYPYVTIVPLACWDKNTTISFYPVIFSHGGSVPVNIGGSSCLVVRKNGADSHHIQGSPIMIEAVRLENWMQSNGIQNVDLICMDVQGATLKVLQGMGNNLKKVKYIITEAYFDPAFYGEALFPEIKSYLKKNGFKVKKIHSCGPFGDVLFINTNF